jgi:hypothetical protein
MQQPPSSPEAQLQWLVDRAAVADVLTALARRADIRDYQGMVDLFADDGIIVVPFGSGSMPARDLGPATEKIFEQYEATHHLLGNIEIDIDGDTARSHHYVLATHLPSRERPNEHADIGAWYDNEYRRTLAGWRLTTLDLGFVYSSGLAFQPGDPGERDAQLSGAAS